MTLLSILDQPVVQRLLGIPRQAAGHIDRLHPALTAPWPVLALASLGIVAVIWFTANYWRDGTRPSWLIKGPLVVLRLIALTALVAMLCQPVLRLGHAEDVRPSVVLMVDTSESMNRPDPRLPAARAEIEGAAAGVSPSDAGSLTRLNRADDALNRAGIMKELSRRFNVHLWEFAGAPHSVTLPSDAKRLASYKFSLGPDVTTGGSTQIGVALRKPIDELAGQPLAGAMIVSDGGNNLGEDPILVAEAARQSGLRVSTVGFGDPTKTKDIALLSVLADDVVRVNNTVSVYAAISQRGYAGRTVAVTLKRGGDLVGREDLHLGPDDQKQEVHFNYVPAQGGRFTYTVEVAPQAGEITAANNHRSFIQTVISKKLKVLYVENEPRYEYRYLKNAILRDTSLDFACLLLSADDASTGGEGNIPISTFPTTEKELFEYDIIVLGDVPRSYFSDAQLKALRRFVEDRGASLLVIAGEEHMPQEYAGTPLEAVLPVYFSASANPIYSQEPFQWQLTPEGRRSPITQLEDSTAASDQVWRDLPGMFWSAGVDRVKPAATVLAVNPNRRGADGPAPLVVTQPFGAGKCFLELVDSTWRWRWRVGDRYFYRYWGQVFRTLTPKELPGNSRFVQLNADRSNYLLGDRVSLNARLLDAYYHPIKADSAVAIVKGENGLEQRVTLEGSPGSPGLYTAQIQPARIGKYEVSLTSPANPEAKASAAFLVETQALERQKPELDEGTLRKIASAGGGRYYQPTDLLKWAKSLPSNGLTVRTEQEIELWDAPFLLIMFLLPICLEWFVRKRKGLL